MIWKSYHKKVLNFLLKFKTYILSNNYFLFQTIYLSEKVPK
ncbi:Uncharacterised protein [Streptococcus pneumoniae]|uniref:Uncharacterized protein n=1 Tax=Streptococcus pneumoniae TaxID=1313 RepID=A0AAI9A100_STREE|nr:Uncharacterised protein [Streptococcus pneumoniae]CEO63608.1 Uncharacterised protein [Streptococcus pneumoniae]CEV56257.1 Uncharacterised protein [Streptococcus pneumoniae]CEZ50457.1 Uncharacterised protein [Streptococcus pneumoniae]CIO94480.1 Uncharacterised protein [Streptococcus pneumoniae]